MIECSKMQRQTRFLERFAVCKFDAQMTIKSNELFMPKQGSRGVAFTINLEPDLKVTKAFKYNAFNHFLDILESKALNVLIDS